MSEKNENVKEKVKEKEKEVKKLEVISPSSNIWSAVVKATSALIEEVNLEFHPTMVSMRSMDTSHIALINLEWNAASFEKYVCDGDHIVALRLADLEKIIKRAEKDDKVEVSLGLGKEHMLNVKIYDGYKREFALHLLDPQTNPVPIPKVEFGAKIVMQLKALKNALADISAVSDQITFKLDKSGAEFSGVSEYGKATAFLPSGSPQITDMSVKDVVTSSYSIEYLNKFLKSLTADQIAIEFGTKFPIKMEVVLDDKGSKLQYYLAPRME